MSKYYITSREYVGPNMSDRCNSHTYSISTVAPRTNSSEEVRTDGWLGTTNDWAKYAHGAFETEESARDEIDCLLTNGYRELDCRDTIGIDDDGCLVYDVARFAVGEYYQADKETSLAWCYEGIRNDVDSDTTDEKIDELLAEYESSANMSDEPFTLDLDVVRREMEARRAIAATELGE